MSVPAHRALRSSRSRRWRYAITGIGAAALALVSIPAFADNVFVDNDVLTSGMQHSIDVTVAPGDPVSANAQMVVKFQGNNDHLTDSSPITVSLDAGPSTFAGITPVSVGDATGTVPAPWDTGSPNFTLTSHISFQAPTTPGAYQLVIHYYAKSYTCDSGGSNCLSAGTGDPFIINLTVEAPTVTNTAPSVDFTDAPTTADEGDTKTFNFSITDPDAGDTQSFATGYPDCGAGNVLASSSITARTFSCTFVDGLVPAVANTVKVKVNDGTTDSNEATTDVMVSNLAPVVAQPSFSVTSVDCQVQVSLNNISFSDAGVNDKTWSIDINWADGSTHDVIPTDTQGLQSSVTHTYTVGGTFAATVTVTDKDHAAGSNTTSSSGSITVIQYRTDFLPPFDDSSPSGLIVNSMKNGRTVPVKATIYDLCAHAYVTSPAAVTIGVKKVASPTTDPASDAIENYSDAGASSGNTNLFRWTSDSTAPGGGFWIYNLDSKALALVTNSYYRIDIYVGGVQATKTDWGILQPLK